MKGVAVLLVFLMFAACKDGGSSASDTCEQALRTASKHVPMLQDQKELAQAVGDCINKQWPVETRKCVAA
ncbi:MAG: hypothetical protein HOV81_30655, partial [Kofleriaceae bacterium]|nr:hypothetical protein [Kofleriaceae bacterium]